MKYKLRFDGITVEISVKKENPLFHKQHWDGTTEETKVLIVNEVCNAESVKFELGGIEVEYEFSSEELLTAIKSIGILSSTIREEIKNWGAFYSEMTAEPKTTTTERSFLYPEGEDVHEATPVSTPDLSNVIAALIKEVKATTAKLKS